MKTVGGMWKRKRTVGNFRLVCSPQTRLMPAAKCPNCGMGFESESSVLKHMNHRYSSCSSFFLHGVPFPTGPSPLPQTPFAPPTTSYSVPFPDAGHAYGRGDGFIGSFFNDKYSDERTSNLYFPFQSKGEWEIASFLSQSGLSMKQIDEFLALDLVR